MNLRVPQIPGNFFGYLKIRWFLYGVSYFQSPIVNFDTEISFVFEGDFCISPATLMINCKLLERRVAVY